VIPLPRHIGGSTGLRGKASYIHEKLSRLHIPRLLLYILTHQSRTVTGDRRPTPPHETLTRPTRTIERVPLRTTKPKGQAPLHRSLVAHWFSTRYNCDRHGITSHLPSWVHCWNSDPVHAEQVIGRRTPPVHTYLYKVRNRYRTRNYLYISSRLLVYFRVDFVPLLTRLTAQTSFSNMNGTDFGRHTQAQAQMQVGPGQDHDIFDEFESYRFSDDPEFRVSHSPTTTHANTRLIDRRACPR
jgi:hypothetical protein